MNYNKPSKYRDIWWFTFTVFYGNYSYKVNIFIIIFEDVHWILVLVICQVVIQKYLVSVQNRIVIMKNIELKKNHGAST